MIVLFWGLFVILIIASAIAIYNLIREEKLNDKREAEQKAQLLRLQEALDTKEKEAEKLNRQILELKEKIFQSQDTLKHELNKKDAETEKLLSQLKNQLLQSQDALKAESLNKTNLEKKSSDLQAQSEKLNKDLSFNIEVHKGLKEQYDELERDMEKLQQELAIKDSAFKTKQSEYQQLNDKYENLLKQIHGSGSEKKEKDIAGEGA